MCRHSRSVSSFQATATLRVHEKGHVRTKCREQHSCVGMILTKTHWCGMQCFFALHATFPYRMFPVLFVTNLVHIFLFLFCFHCKECCKEDLVFVVSSFPFFCREKYFYEGTTLPVMTVLPNNSIHGNQ